MWTIWAPCVNLHCTTPRSTGTSRDSTESRGGHCPTKSYSPSSSSASGHDRGQTEQSVELDRSGYTYKEDLLHPAVHTWVTEITPRHLNDNGESNKHDNFFFVEEIMATADRRIRDEAGLDEPLQTGTTIGRQPKRQRENAPRGNRETGSRLPAVPLQTRMMKIQEIFNPVERTQTN